MFSGNRNHSLGISTHSVVSVRQDDVVNIILYEEDVGPELI